MNLVRIIRNSAKPVRVVNTGGVVYFVTGEGGIPPKEFVLTNHTAGRFRHNFGKVPSVTVLDSAGRVIGAAVRHIYDTPGSSLTNEFELLSNQPISGTLLVHL